MSEPAVEPTATPEPTPAPTPAPEPTPAAGWRDGLDADLQANPSLGKFDGVPALAKSYVELEGLVGRKGIIQPKEGDSEDVYNDFYSQLGRPGTPEEYDFDGFTPPEVLANVWSDDLQTGVVKAMHKLGLSQAQTRGVVEAYAEIQAEQASGMLTDMTAAGEVSQKALKTEWGAAYPAKVEAARNAWRLAFPENHEAMSNKMLEGGTRIGDDPDFVRLFAKLGEGSQEHGWLGGKQRTTKTPEEADTELLTLDKHPALYDKDHPEHQAIVNRRNALYMQLHPDPVQDDRV